MTALVLQVLSMATFILAQSVEFLFAARTLQGAATGVAAGAISAWLVDLQPRENPGLGGFVTGIALLAGLGTGAVGSGLLLQYAPYPLRLVYWVLGGAFLIAILSVAFMPEVVTRASGVLRSLRPQLGVPDSTRSTFTAVTPTLVAMWALAGLYLSLGPSLAIALLGKRSSIAGGFVILALMGSAALGSVFARRLVPRVAIIRGSLGMVLGVAITIAAVVTESLSLLYVGSAIAGLALGPAFSGVMQTLGSLAPVEKRGALFGSIYIVIYVSISVPTVLAGVAVGRVPLQDATYVYGFVVMILAGITSVAVTRRRKSSADSSRSPRSSAFEPCSKARRARSRKQVRPRRSAR